MTALEEALIRLNEEELQGKKKTVEVEGADFMGKFAEINKLIQAIIDGAVNTEYVLYEDLEFIDEKQANCIKELGELMDRLEQYN